MKNRSSSRSPVKKDQKILEKEKPLSKRPLSQDHLIKPHHCRKPSDPLVKIVETKKEEMHPDLLDLWEYCELEDEEQVA